MYSRLTILTHLCLHIPLHIKTLIFVFSSVLDAPLRSSLSLQTVETQKLEILIWLLSDTIWNKIQKFHCSVIETIPKAITWGFNITPNACPPLLKWKPLQNGRLDLFSYHKKLIQEDYDHDLRKGSVKTKMNLDSIKSL